MGKIFECNKNRWRDCECVDKCRRGHPEIDVHGKKDKIRVYLASPYTLGDTAVNVKHQMDMVDFLMDKGFAPFAPLYSHFQHMVHPRPYEDWIEIDLVWVRACDCLLRMGGESKGADGEVAEAKRLGIPVFFNVDDLLKYYYEDTEFYRKDTNTDKVY